MKRMTHHIKSTPILDLYGDMGGDFLSELDQRVHIHDADHRNDAIHAWVN